MNLELLRAVLGWCSLINFGILLVWFLMLVLCHDLIYKVRGKWFKLNTEQFDAIHYALLGVFKMGVFLFNFIPYLALRIVL